MAPACIRIPGNKTRHPRRGSNSSRVRPSQIRGRCSRKCDSRGTCAPNEVGAHAATLGLFCPDLGSGGGSPYLVSNDAVRGSPWPRSIKEVDPTREADGTPWAHHRQAHPGAENPVQRAAWGRQIGMNGWRKRLADEIEDRGLKMKEVSLAAGLGESYVRDALKRGRGKFENLRRIAAVLGKSVDWLIDDSGGAVPLRSYIPPNASVRLPNSLMETAPLPLYGHAAAGKDGRFVLNGELIGITEGPASLVDVEGAYGVIVSGDSMLPRYRAGEVCVVDPRKLFRRTDDVVVQVEAEPPGDPPEGFVKEFVSLSDTTLVLRQHNPPRTIRFSRKIVRTVHLVIGSLRA